VLQELGSLWITLLRPAAAAAVVAVVTAPMVPNRMETAKAESRTNVRRPTNSRMDPIM